LLYPPIVTFEVLLDLAKQFALIPCRGRNGNYRGRLDAIVTAQQVLGCWSLVLIALLRRCLQERPKRFLYSVV
jgi:hypothetical protein